MKTTTERRGFRMRWKTAVTAFFMSVAVCHGVMANADGGPGQDLDAPDVRLIYDGPFGQTARRNFWNSGWNVNGLRTDSVTVSYAELHGNMTSGGFRDYFQAASSWTTGAEAGTITHLKRFSMSGSFSFDHFSGKGMCGSMSARPGYYPVDVLEFTPGGKTMQTYSFSGGISVDISSHWRLGGKIDYTGANYTKRKDLRHANYLLDMTVSPSVMYHADNMALGFSYIFGKNSESIDAEELGISSSSYYAFLDKGLMYGAYEVWEGSGVHLAESGINGFPVKEMQHGAAIQAQFMTGPARRNALYAEIAGMYTIGEAGEKQSIWFVFPGFRINASLGYAFGKDECRNFLRLGVKWSSMENNENVIGQETSNGVTVTKTYGSNRIFGRQVLTISPEYELVADGFSFKAGARFTEMFRSVSQMYPYVVSRNDITGEIYAAGKIRVHRFDVKAGVQFRSGGSSEHETTLDEDIVTGDLPYRLTDWYDMQNEYMTASRLGVAIGLRYNFMKGLYVEASAGYARGFGLKCLPGKDRWSENLKLGYTF